MTDAQLRILLESMIGELERTIDNVRQLMPEDAERVIEDVRQLKPEIRYGSVASLSPESYDIIPTPREYVALEPLIELQEQWQQRAGNLCPKGETNE